MAEVRLAATCGDDQAVVGEIPLDEPRYGRRVHYPAFQVEAGDVGQLNGHVPVLAQQMAEHVRDLAGERMPVATW